MEKIPIYTIGYGNRSIEEFINLLVKNIRLPKKQFNETEIDHDWRVWL